MTGSLRALINDGQHRRRTSRESGELLFEDAMKLRFIRAKQKAAPATQCGPTDYATRGAALLALRT